MRRKLVIGLFMLCLLMLGSGCYSIPQLKNPLHTTTIIAGIFNIALLDKDEFDKDVIVFAKNQPMPLCKAWQLQPATHDVLVNRCLPIYGNNRADCQEIFGCVSIRVDKSVKEDAHLWGRLLAAIQSPCKILAQDYVRRSNAKVIFPYSVEVLEDNFSCKSTQRLPYKKVVIAYGDEYSVFK